MQDEHPHLIAECSTCGFRFDILFGVGCPRCRTEAVREAFRPVDSLRTAMGIAGLKPDDELDVWHWHGDNDPRFKESVNPLTGERYMRGKAWREEDWTEEAPKGCRMPKDEASQVYELKRMFRL